MIRGNAFFGLRRAIRVAFALACAVVCASASAADRVALLIGNNNYGTKALRNAANDAHDLGDALKEMGFQVIVRENASRKDMIEAIREFGQAIDGANAALFFYAGHAMQFKDRNYLIPIDAAMGAEEDVTFFSVEIGQIFDRMERARTRFNFIILDACRENPFAASFKLTSAGLAQVNAPSGTLIAYATSPGSTAADGYGRNGIYTKNILQNIRVPDLPVEIMFKRVREGVERETKKSQTPWDSSSLKGDFAFNASGAHPTQPAGSAPSADVTLQIEREFWISVRDSSRPDDIRAYLDKYPNGNFAVLARNKLDALVRPARVAEQSGTSSGRVDTESTAAVPSGSAATTRGSQGDVTNSPRAAGGVSMGRGVAATDPMIATDSATAASGRSTTERRIADPLVAAEKPAAENNRASAAEKAVVVAMSATTSADFKSQDPTVGREVPTGIREVLFADGSVYRGGVRGKSPHGRGEYVSKAYRYEGEFNDGIKQGEGIYLWNNGDRYQGNFANDLPDGRGNYRFANGDVYEGDVKLGAVAGRGTYVTRSGDVIEGSFANGKPQGVGVYRFANGDRYEGELDEGRLHGRGRYLSKNGDQVEAPFVNGKAQGSGIYKFANGDRYEGELQAGTITGKGAYFYGSGMKYEGEMRAGQPYGKGVFWFVDGARFEGEFENGLAIARGEIIKQDGSRAPAEIVDGKAKLLEK